MNMKLKVTMLMAGLLALPALTSTAQAVSVTSKKVSAAAQQAAQAALTAEKLANELPVPMPIDYGISTPLAAEAAAAPTGKAGRTGAGMAAFSADKVASEAYPAAWNMADDAESALAAALAASEQPTGTRGVYTYYDVNVNSAFWKVFPHKWWGRLSSTAGFCSATVVSGNNIVTAAHCLYNTTTNRWYSGWVFTPAYRAGNAPYGTFTANTCWILTAYVNLSGSYSINTWAKHDVGICKLNRNSAGQTINQAVGFAGREWNWPYERLVFNGGYPFQNYNLANLPNAGAYLRACVAESFFQATDVRGEGCFYGPGISGGAWLNGYKPFVVAGWTTTVNSGLFVGQQNLYGGRFTSNNIVPLCNAAGC